MAWSGSVPVAELVDTATGAKYTVRQPRRPATSFGRRFSVIFDETVAQIATQISGTSARVWMSLPLRLDFRSWKKLRQVELAEQLDLTQSAVSKALQELLRHSVVEKQGRGTATEWRLCRKVGYRGSVGQFHEDERKRHVSHLQPVPQPSLPLGPSRTVRGGRKTLVEPKISQEPPHLHAV